MKISTPINILAQNNSPKNSRLSNAPSGRFSAVQNRLGTLPYDIFEKSPNVSFKGLDSDEEYGTFRGFIGDLLIDAIVNSYVNSVLEQIRKEQEREGAANILLEFALDNRMRQFAKINKLHKIEDYAAWMSEGSDKQDDYYNLDTEYIVDLLKKANITTYEELSRFAKLCMGTPELEETFKDQYIEAIKIYSLLKTKSSFSTYNKLLLNLYNNEASKDEPDFDKLNDYVTFLQDFKVETPEDFSKKFAGIKNEFNNFETTTDRAEALEYLYLTKPKKLELIENAMQAACIDTKDTPEKIYAKSNDIVDFLFEQNPDTRTFVPYIEYMVQENALSPDAIKAFGPLFNNFETPDDRMDFYKTLISFGIEGKGVNRLAKKSIGADLDSLEFIINMDILPPVLEELTGCSPEEAKETYIRFKDVLITLYDENDENSLSLIKEFLKQAETFNFKDNQGFLTFYNHSNGKIKKRLTKEEMTGFIKNIQAKTQKPEDIETPKTPESAKESKERALKASTRRFITKYSGKNGVCKNLYKFLDTLPDKGITLEEAVKTVEKAQGILDIFSIPITIDNENILNLDIAYFKASRKNSGDCLNKLLTELCSVPKDYNFITALPNALVRNPQKYTSYRIAEEIVGKMDKSSESYRNLANKLKISKTSLGLDKDISDYLYTKAVAMALPDEFVDFVNSKNWIDFSGNKNALPNISLHARLRMIDRFALNNDKPIESLYTKETENKLNNMVKSLYTTTPTNVRITDTSKRIVFNTEINGQNIEAVATNTGEIVTIVQRTWK